MLQILGGLVLDVKLLLTITNSVKNALHQAGWRSYTGPDCEGQFTLGSKHPKPVGCFKPQPCCFLQQWGDRWRIDHIIDQGSARQTVESQNGDEHHDSCQVTLYLQAHRYRPGTFQIFNTWEQLTNSVSGNLDSINEASSEARSGVRLAIMILPAPARHKAATAPRAAPPAPMSAMYAPRTLKPNSLASDLIKPSPSVL